MILLLLKQLLKSIGSSIVAGSRFVVANPFVLVMVLIGCLIGAVASCNTNAEKKDRYREALTIEQLRSDSLILACGRLIHQRESAYHYADSLNAQAHATRDSIKTVVAALPAAQRSQLNRRLLAGLGLLQ